MSGYLRWHVDGEWSDRGGMQKFDWEEVEIDWGEVASEKNYKMGIIYAILYADQWEDYWRYAK